MAIEFVCPWCTQDISADEKKTGTTIECPQCNFPVKVPAKSTHEPPPSLPPSSPSSADTPASGSDSAVSEPPLPPASPPSDGETGAQGDTKPKREMFCALSIYLVASFIWRAVTTASRISQDQPAQSDYWVGSPLRHRIDLWRNSNFQ